MFKKFIYTILLSISFTTLVNATIVEFQTSQGNFQVNLFDSSTPKTVNNFLQYVEEQHYTNSVVHRVSSNFVVQGGGYTFEGNFPLTRIETNPAVINEPIYSNVRGTIAMAKLGGDPDSATDQWFFNLADNASNLDLQNSGFTVFGQVIGDGMTTIDNIAQLTLCNSANLEGIPMVIADDQQCSDLATPGIENFVIVEQIVIVDSAEVTDGDLSPVRNTLITAPTEPTPTPDNDSSGGGTFAWFILLSLIPLLIRRYS
ncbi:peptidylprolyl isomerase [Colwellia sp. 1_MG-2023]|uniref:peptidylprolyl isomerase n=1 Tax=unclassified Colwellia TaxID=196834 RepID=UPI001C085E88|nr:MULTISPECIES: peptidylprolyl isomerase [unclassified Colwellia]MBU2926192.1 peptidylprolyl isomerase [Colwellia sp. C2M11]MDO6652387.1 peptidylprolyl isomerase [Colwellia sp. 3_MG-2023]MDO6665738.1 peptidylprolyl isomerase [Colwellia sp. 2_MG-2023]MDO6690111.1 peptidylprolyl isomerase [Colwellia sp. 1_MG-2023]